MKKMKFLTLAVAVLLSVGSASAQVDKTFSFLDAEGNEVADGSTVTFYAVEEEKVPGMPMFGIVSQAKFDLSVKNNTNAAAKVALRVSAPFEPKSGRVQICFPGACDMSHDKGLFTTETGDMLANEIKPLGSEWIFDKGIYSEEKVSLTILSGDAVGPTVNINCIYVDPTGIADMEADKNATVVARYDSKGNKLSAPAKGLNIIKLSNGKTIKTIIK